MTDYPTAAEIDAAADTLARLRIYTQGNIAQRLKYSALTDALAVLDDLAATQPKPEPEPEPQPTAAEILGYALWGATEDGTPEESILRAAKQYAELHPEWFRGWHDCTTPSGALLVASNWAGQNDDAIAYDALRSASKIAKARPDLFGDTR